MAHEPAARRFDVDDYYRMAAAGILTEDDRVELIEGEIVEMPPMGSRHAACIAILTRQLVAASGGHADLRVQLPLHLDDHSEPEPDLALVRPRADRYATAHPTAADVLLVVEVADTSLRFDRSVKGGLYARAGIPVYWLVDLTSDRVEVRTDPLDGRYVTTRVLQRGDRLTLTSEPTIDLAVDELLG